jgi:hypothetical protein
LSLGVLLSNYEHNQALNDWTWFQLQEKIRNVFVFFSEKGHVIA